MVLYIIKPVYFSPYVTAICPHWNRSTFTWLCGAADRLLESAAVRLAEFDHMAVVSDPSHRAWPSVILIRSEQTERICPSLSAVGFRAMSQWYIRLYLSGEQMLALLLAGPHREHLRGVKKVQPWPFLGITPVISQCIHKEHVYTHTHAQLILKTCSFAYLC